MCPVGAVLYHADRQTDGQAPTKLIVTFFNFANKPKNRPIILLIKTRSVTLARMREKINAYRVLVGKPERKEPLATPTHTW